jgi:hypothetical protein
MAIQHKAFAGMTVRPWPALVTTQIIPGNTELEIDYGNDFATPPDVLRPSTDGQRLRAMQSMPDAH